MAWSALSVDDAGNVQRDIRNDITNFQFATPRAVQDVTGVDKSAIERLLLLADFSGTLNGVANFGAVPSATAHGVFATVPSTSVNRLITITIGGKTLAPTCILTDYALTRAASGELTWQVPFSLASGTVPTWA